MSDRDGPFLAWVTSVSSPVKLRGPNGRYITLKPGELVIVDVSMVQDELKQHRLLIIDEPFEFVRAQLLPHLSGFDEWGQYLTQAEIDRWDNTFLDLTTAEMRGDISMWDRAGIALLEIAAEGRDRQEKKRDAFKILGLGKLFDIE